MTKSFVFKLVVLILFLLTLSSCQASAPANQAAGVSIALKVTAVETFLGDIAQNVAGSRVKVESLVPIGVDPHAFEPAPQDIVKLAQAQVIIANGAGFEAWLQKTIANTGGTAAIIEASNGLAPRTAREGEAAEMSDADLADSMCAAASQGAAQPALTGPDAANAVELPAESGLFRVTLLQAGDGSYGGYFKFVTDETGDFQMAFGPGRLAVSQLAGSAEVKIRKALPLECQNLALGNIAGLKKNTPYLIALSGSPATQAALLIGPAGGVHHHDTDPHFWLDPNNVIRYVENIRVGLIQADPQGKELYTQNASAYVEKLNQLNGWIQAQVSLISPDRRLLVTNHESFGYFADRYGFRIVGTVVPSVGSDASPSAQQIARLEDRVKADGAIAIFLETGANPQLAQQVASDTGVKVVAGLYTHSITAPDGQAPTYIDMMRYNVTALVNALK